MDFRLPVECSNTIRRFIGKKSSTNTLAIHNLQFRFSYYNTDLAMYTVEKVHSKEECFVDNVKLCGDFTISGAKKACITVRVPVSIETQFCNLSRYCSRDSRNIRPKSSGQMRSFLE